MLSSGLGRANKARGGERRAVCCAGTGDCDCDCDWACGVPQPVASAPEHSRAIVAAAGGSSQNATRKADLQGGRGAAHACSALAAPATRLRAGDAGDSNHGRRAPQSVARGASGRRGTVFALSQPRRRRCSLLPMRPAHTHNDAAEHGPAAISLINDGFGSDKCRPGAECRLAATRWQ